MANQPKDRSYYRTMETTALREEIHYGINVDWKELAIALAERLDTVRNEVYDAVGADKDYDGEWNYCPDCGYELR